MILTYDNALAGRQRPWSPRQTLTFVAAASLLLWGALAGTLFAVLLMVG